MKTKTVAAALTAGLALAVPSVAQADYYIGRAKAQSFAEDYVSDRYGSNYPGAFCRPQGASAPARGYIYHRWVCYWADEYKCEGSVLIYGSSRGRNHYAYRVLRGQRCP
jgi:hypothetical protein